MRQAPRIRLEADAEQRGAYLARVYADIAEDRGRLGATIDQLRPYHRAELIRGWQALADAGQMAELARDLVVHHYDPKYARQRARDTQPDHGNVRLKGFDSGALETAAGQIMALSGSFAGAIS
jgi:tRNA 2-selenouridine synthase